MGDFNSFSFCVCNSRVGFRIPPSSTHNILNRPGLLCDSHHSHIWSFKSTIRRQRLSKTHPGSRRRSRQLTFMFSFSFQIVDRANFGCFIVLRVGYLKMRRWFVNFVSCIQIELPTWLGKRLMEIISNFLRYFEITLDRFLSQTSFCSSHA